MLTSLPFAAISWSVNKSVVFSGHFLLIQNHVNAEHKSKEEVKDQESIQKSITPDPGHYMSSTYALMQI